MKRPLKYDDAIIARCAKLFADGKSYTMIGAEVGLTSNQIAGMFARHNVPCRRKTETALFARQRREERQRLSSTPCRPPDPWPPGVHYEDVRLVPIHAPRA